MPSLRSNFNVFKNSDMGGSPQEIHHTKTKFPTFTWSVSKVDAKKEKEQRVDDSNEHQQECTFPILTNEKPICKDARNQECQNVGSKEGNQRAMVVKAVVNRWEAWNICCSWQIADLLSNGLQIKSKLKILTGLYVVCMVTRSDVKSQRIQAV